MQRWGLFSQPLQRRIHCSGKVLQAALFLKPSVNKDRESSPDSGLAARPDVFLDLTRHLWGLALIVEGFFVQVKLGTDFFHLGLIKFAVVDK
jgi:hypothetical protein